MTGVPTRHPATATASLLLETRLPKPRTSSSGKSSPLWFTEPVQQARVESCATGACRNRANYSSFSYQIFFLDYTQLCSKDVLKSPISQ